MSKIQLLRHFDKTHTSGELTGNMDVHMSPLGKKKSRLFANFYAGEFDGYHILSSRSSRCTDLVDIIKLYNSIKTTTILTSLTERDYKSFQGLPKNNVIDELSNRFEELGRQHGKDLTARLDEELYDGQGELLFEPTHHLRKRISQELFYQFSRLEGQDILFVGHTGTIRTLLTMFMDVSNNDLDTYLSQKDGRAHIIYGALQIIENGELVAINHLPKELVQILGYGH